ncbi:MAG: hypothetical protein HOQ13_09860, partial [Dermatophilaceae bacterium]|nr:hypothetical protein [Dermatophilaceae bacterium]
MDESAHIPDHDQIDDPDELEQGPEPRLDPAVAAQVTALLAAAPDPGPMPADVEARISAALADVARLRVDPGPLLAAGQVDEAAHGEGLSTDSNVVAMPTRASRPRPIYLVAAVAAAAAVV